MFPIAASLFVNEYADFLSQESLSSIAALNLEDSLRYKIKTVKGLFLTPRENVDFLKACDLGRCFICMKLSNWLSVVDVGLCSCGKLNPHFRRIFNKEFAQSIGFYALIHLRESQMTSDIFAFEDDVYKWKTAVIKFLKVHQVFRKHHPLMWDYVSRKMRTYKAIASHKISRLDPRRLLFLLTQTKIIYASYNPHWYREIQTNLSVIYCVMHSCPAQLKILMDFGHEKAFIEDELTKEDVALRGHDYFQKHYVLSRFHLTCYSRPKRAFLLLQMFLVCVAEKHAMEVAELMWRALPYPFITKKEMDDFVDTVFNSRNPSLKQEVGQQFEKLFGNPKLTPRSLEHYARCKIRRVLNDRGVLPEGINRLRLPEKLLQYLKLEF